MPEPEAPTRTRGLDGLTSALLLAAVGTATASFGSVLTDVQWWFVGMLVATVVLATAATVRSLTRRRGWATLGSVVATIVALTLLFAPGTAVLGLIPTLGTLEALHALEVAGGLSIANQALPANADQGIVYLLCLGIAAICVALDLLALTLRRPALAGLPLLVLLLVPSAVDPALNDGLFFALTAAAYVGLLLVRSRPATRAAGTGIAAVAVLVALLVPLGLPSVGQPPGSEGGTPGAGSGINPLLDLGEDLRRGDASLAITYVTSEPGGTYLRLTALDDFDGQAWKPSAAEMIPGNSVAQIGAVPGLGGDVPTAAVTTGITVADITTRWLPVPYAPRSIAGLEGSWGWEPAALAIRTETSNARGQEYTVRSLTVSPSVEQLLAAGTTVEAGLERDLAVPPDLAPVVADTAARVTGGAATHYEKALALQSYLRGPEFSYSEQAPVEDGYDGSGAAVLGQFLEAKAGYCVHFSSAMAAMARTLGIPARVIVGFAPGQLSSTAGPGLSEYRVTTHDLHAWPELHFAGIGWVRFEPTPGRVSPPEFAPLSADDPATPDVDESVPVPTTTDPPSSTPAPSAPDEEPAPTAAPDAVGDAASSRPPWWGGALAALTALLLVPAVVRIARRARRSALVSRGSATAAWDELRDTADDLALHPSATRTPRQLAGDLAPHLDDGGVVAVARLLAALEAEAFAGRTAAPQRRDLSAAVSSLRRKAGPLRTAAALLLPRSLVARWRAGAAATRGAAG